MSQREKINSWLFDSEKLHRRTSQSMLLLTLAGVVAGYSLHYDWKLFLPGYILAALIGYVGFWWHPGSEKIATEWYKEGGNNA